MYVLLCGYPPFFGNNNTDVFARVKRGAFTFVCDDWKDVSDDACDLITKMLKKNPDTRSTAQQALEHVWIAEKTPKEKPIALAGDMIGHLKAYSSQNKLKKAALHIIATHLDDSEVKHLRALFLQLDKNSDGALTIDEMVEGLKQSGIKDGVFNQYFETIISQLFTSI